jgi:hypothetical protein
VTPRRRSATLKARKATSGGSGSWPGIDNGRLSAMDLREALTHIKTLARVASETDDVAFLQKHIATKAGTAPRTSPGQTPRELVGRDDAAGVGSARKWDRR